LLAKYKLIFSILAERLRFYPSIYPSKKAEYGRTLANKDAARGRIIKMSSPLWAIADPGCQGAHNELLALGDRLNATVPALSLSDISMARCRPLAHAQRREKGG
jgi:hypothetical protein